MEWGEKVAVLVESGLITTNVKCPSLLQLLLERGALLAVQVRICLSACEGNNFLPIFDGKDGRSGRFGGDGTFLSGVVMVPQSNFLYSS